MKLYMTWLLVSVASMVLAQAPKPAPRAEAPTAAAKALPTISDQDKLALRDLQVESLQLADQLKDLVTKYQQLQQQSQAVNAKIGQKVEEVFKAAKLDQKDYQIDPQKLVFVPKPPPATPATKK